MKIIRQYFFIILLLLATFMLGYNYFFRPFEQSVPSKTQNSATTIPIDEEYRRSPEYVLTQMSTEEKISQMVAMPVIISVDSTTEETETQTSIASVSASLPRTGFYTIFGSKISKSVAQKVIFDLKQKFALYDLIPMVAVDHEGGSVQRLSGEGFTKLDSWQEICKLETVDRQAELKRSANELRLVGIDIVLAPVLDVGNNKILKDRVCSKDSYPVVADRSMDYVTIFSTVGILPVVKHFPGIGLTTKDLHADFDSVSVLENDIKLYKYILDQNSKIGVMTAHVGVTSQDKEIPCSVSKFCVAELNEAYPDVLVFTDALEMQSARYDTNNPQVPKSLTQVSKEAIFAGNTILLYGQSVTADDLSQIISDLAKEYEANLDFKSLVDKSVLKIVQYKSL